jgi:5-methyltetrahydrofolate--homocysteine methyltransferase
MIDSGKFAQAFLDGKVEEVKKLTQGYLDQGEKAEDVISQGLIKAMDQVGVKFKNDEIYLPEVLIAARAMHAGMAILKPLLSKASAAAAPKIVLGTVKGDLHDIGKRLVAMMLEGGGFEVIDVGVDTPPEKFVQAAKDHGAQVVAMSALLTTTMLEMKSVVEALKAAGLSNSVKTIIGGAPVTEGFAQKIGADGYARDAASAVEKIRELLAR